MAVRRPCFLFSRSFPKIFAKKGNHRPQQSPSSLLASPCPAAWRHQGWHSFVLELEATGCHAGPPVCPASTGWSS